MSKYVYSKKDNIIRKLRFILVLFPIIAELYTTRADILDRSKPLTYTTFTLLFLVNHLILIIYGYFVLVVFNIRVRSLLDLYLYTLMLGFPSLASISLVLAFLRTLNTEFILFITFFMTLFIVYAGIKKHKTRIGMYRVHDDIIVIMLLIYSFMHFARVAYSLNVAPPGDSFTYGMLASLIYYNNGVPSTYFPILNCSFFYFPHNILRIGFSSLVALSSFISKVSPIHTVVVVSALISYAILVVPTLFIYSITRKIVLTLLIFLLLYIVPNGIITPPFSNNDPILSNLINGTYSQHLGNFLIASFLLLLYCVSYKPYKQINNRRLANHFIIITAIIYLITIVFSSIRVLPIFFIIMLIYIYNIMQRSIKVIIINRKYTLLLLTLLISLTLFMSHVYNEVSEKFITNFGVNPEYTYMSFSEIIEKRLYHFVIMCLAMFTIFLKFVESEKLNIIDITLIALFILLILATLKNLYIAYLWFISPMRSLLIVYTLSIIVLVININALNKFRRLIVLIVVFIIFSQISGIYFNVVYISPKWMRVYEPAYSAIKHILDVAQPTDLILNDPNWIGFAIPLFRPQNVVFDRTFLFIMTSMKDNSTFAKRYLERAKEALYILKNPSNVSAFRNFIAKYNVKYVFISQYNTYYDPFLHEYKRKYEKQTFTEYLNALDKNPCLEILLIIDNLRVYKVRENCISNTKISYQYFMQHT